MRNGGAAHKNIETPQNFDSASRRRHLERSREIFIAERSSPDVRQHQDIVFPRRIHADSRSAVKIEGYARNDDAREALSKLRGASDFYAPHQHSSLLTPNSSLLTGE